MAMQDDSADKEMESCEKCKQYFHALRELGVKAFIEVKDKQELAKRNALLEQQLRDCVPSGTGNGQLGTNVIESYTEELKKKEDEIRKLRAENQRLNIEQTKFIDHIMQLKRQLNANAEKHVFAAPKAEIVSANTSPEKSPASKSEADMTTRFPSTSSKPAGLCVGSEASSSGSSMQSPKLAEENGRLRQLIQQVGQKIDADQLLVVEPQTEISDAMCSKFMEQLESKIQQPSQRCNMLFAETRRLENELAQMQVHNPVVSTELSRKLVRYDLLTKANESLRQTARQTKELLDAVQGNNKSRVNNSSAVVKTE